MIDMEARTIIEALRSGIPSKEVGRYFSEARPALMNKTVSRLEDACEAGKSSGMVVIGKYGEGKTHLLSAVHVIASDDNMVVSQLSLGKEGPMDKLYVIYQKMINNTYLPGQDNPGFADKLLSLTPENPLSDKILDYCSNSLETNKLYYVFRSLIYSDDSEDRYRLLMDLQGDLLPNATLRAISKKTSTEKVRFNIPFAKSKHMMDYFFAMSHLFRLLGYSGWAILFDEAELLGRLSKKARLLAYDNIYSFLHPKAKLENTFSLFALSASYEEDVIEGKNEYENAEAFFPENRQIPSVLDSLKKGTRLTPLTKEEMLFTFEKLISFHGKAYDWNPQIDAESLLRQAGDAGFLLRTKIRYAIEILDELYQYGEKGETTVGTLTEEDIVREDDSSEEENPEEGK